MKILAYPSPSAARRYRLDQVGKYIMRQSRNSFYVSIDPMNKQDLQNADVIILQQTIGPDKLKWAKEYKDKGKLLVAEVDDFFGVNPDNPFKDKHEELNSSKWLEVLCGIADVVTTTTDYLANYIKQKLAKNKVKKPVAVLPNYLDMEIWDLPKQRNFTDEVRIVWAGSCTHREDMKFIAPVIKKLCKEHPSLKFIHCGDVELVQLFKDINSEYVDGVPFEAWPAKLHSFRADIGIAPLLDNQFNRCKSNLKYLEYGIAGLPGVYSNVVYDKTVKDGKTGFIAKTKDEFYSKLKRLIINPELRERIGSNAYIDVKGNYDIRNQALRWLNVYWEHLSKKQTLKLDIGGGQGSVRGKSWVNIDVDPRYAEIRKDIKTGLPLADDCAVHIHASAILEHFYIEDLREKVLPELYRLLKKGGRFYAAVPDWQAVRTTNNWGMKQQNIYGARHKELPIEFDIHKYIFDYKHLKQELEKAGFVKIKKIPYDEINHDPKYTLAVEATK